MAEDQVNSDLKVVVIGGSAGSLEVLLHVLPGLSKINYAIVIVLHRKWSEDSALEDLIAARTVLPVQIVEDKTELLPGFIYVAPADYHLLFEKNLHLSLDLSEKISHSRPSIDVSFESAADAFGSNLVGILLSGANNDGTKGLAALQHVRATTIVQDPATAQMPFMPKHAIDYLKPDLVLDIQSIAEFLRSFSN